MKYLVVMISVLIIFVTFGCTKEIPVENSKMKVETTSTEIGKEMSVHVIDVGQGDSILIQSPGGKNMLIDGGSRESGKNVVAFLRNN